MLRHGERAKPVLATVVELGLGRKAVMHELIRRLRNHDLATVGELEQPSSAVERGTEVVPPALCGAPV